MALVEAGQAGDVQTMSASGYLLSVEDGSGTVWFSISDAGVASLVGNASASANLTVDTDLTVDDTFNIDDTAYTLTGMQTLTPTASYYELNPGGQLTITLAAACTAGDLYLFANKANQAVTFVDTNIRTTDGNAVAMDQYDTVAWQCVGGTEYYLMYNSANQ